MVKMLEKAHRFIDMNTVSDTYTKQAANYFNHVRITHSGNKTFCSN
jgi:hypothetical protein